MDFRPVSSLALVVKEGNPAAERLARIIESWLRDRGVPVWTAAHGGDRRCCDALPAVDLVLAFGGDGTLVSVARQLMGRRIPLAGANFGRVGFLAEFPRENWEKPLTAILENGIRAEERMALRYSLTRGNCEIQAGLVVNDVVVTRGKLARLANLTLGVNDAHFMELRSDGLILSTPTGSTGYAGSAGGSLLMPQLNAYIVAAICPYLSSFPPLVLDADTVFSVTVGEAGTDLFLTLDGQHTHPLTVGDTIRAQGVPGSFLVADLGLTGYFERLQLVGFVQKSKTAG